MPPDQTKRPRRRRRDDEFEIEGLHARDVEAKRNRGEISCAECRRLKIKCDKQIPCQSCQRRGCAALCPNGSLATGEGTRFVLAATEHLHKRLGRMRDRIRALEDALAKAHEAAQAGDGSTSASWSNDPSLTHVNGDAPPQHPLLRADLVAFADEEDGLEDEDVKPTMPATNTTEVVDGFGMLSISEDGVSRFYGPTGAIESLLVNETDSPSTSQSATPASSPPLMHTNSTNGTPQRNAPTPPSAFGNGSMRDSLSPPPPLPDALARIGASFPFAAPSPGSETSGVRELQSTLEAQLPPYERACQLAQLYLDQFAWLFRSLGRAQLVEELLPGIYRRASPALLLASPGCKPDRLAHLQNQSGPSHSQPPHQDTWPEYSAHDLALLFSVFAVGALVDLALEPSNAEADKYQGLARSSLALQSVFEKPCLATIQTLHLLSIWNAMHAKDPKGRDREAASSMETTWSMLSLASQLAHSIGLHRDPGRWGLAEKLLERRRVVFWDLFVADCWNALANGRPPAFCLDFIDCQFPVDGDQRIDQQGKIVPGYEAWGFRFAAECVNDVARKTLTAEAPTYATIMELDRKVRTFPIPGEETSDPEANSKHGLGVPGPRTTNDRGSVEAPQMVGSGGLPEEMQRFVLSHTKDVILLYIHRSFFAQAIIDHPENPLKSAHAPSFIAAFKSSTTILKMIRQQFAMKPEICSRFWSMWTFAFSAAVVFGTVVVRGPKSPLAPAATTELDQACELFTKASTLSNRAAKALPILLRLREKAQGALNSLKSGANEGAAWNVRQGDEDDELAIFAGRAKVRAAKSVSPAPMSPPQIQLPAVSLQGYPTMQNELALSTPPHRPSTPTAAVPASAPSSLNMPWEAHDFYVPSRHDYPSPPHPLVPSHPHVQPQQAQFTHQDPGSQPLLPHLDQSSQHRTDPYGRVQQWAQSTSHAQMAPYAHNSGPYQPMVVMSDNYMRQQGHPYAAAHRIRHQHSHQALRGAHAAGQDAAFAEPAYNGMQLQHPYGASADLNTLGLASRDSRLDQRWTNFMHDTGLF